MRYSISVFLGFYFLLEETFDFAFIGLPQHHNVVPDMPQSSMTTSLPQGIQTSFCPFFNFAIIYLLILLLVPYCSAIIRGYCSNWQRK